MYMWSTFRKIPFVLFHLCCALWSVMHVINRMFNILAPRAPPPPRFESTFLRGPEGCRSCLLVSMRNVTLAKPITHLIMRMAETKGTEHNSLE